MHSIVSNLVTLCPCQHFVLKNCHGTSVESLTRQTGKARDRTHDPWFTRRVALPLHQGGFCNQLSGQSLIYNTRTKTVTCTLIITFCNVIHVIRQGLSFTFLTSKLLQCTYLYIFMRVLYASYFDHSDTQIENKSINICIIRCDIYLASTRN